MDGDRGTEQGGVWGGQEEVLSAPEAERGLFCQVFSRLFLHRKHTF